MRIPEGKNIINKIPQFFKELYIKLFKINDSPQRIALGLGLGVFAGIIPGTGPLFALFLAFIFRVNRASALLGSLLTNTWLSIVTFLLAIKVGSGILKINWQEVHKGWVLLFERFNWQDLFKLSVLKAVFPVVVGYIIIAFCLGVFAYLITWVIIVRVKRKAGTA